MTGDCPFCRRTDPERLHSCTVDGGLMPTARLDEHGLLLIELRRCRRNFIGNELVEYVGTVGIGTNYCPECGKPWWGRGE